jgi:hypothetical protein
VRAQQPEHMRRVGELRNLALWPHELRDRIPNCNQVAHARRTC